MAQRCPICRTRLWTHPMLTPARLKCPRCGAVFRTTVPWGYFRVLLLLLVVLTLLVIHSLSETHFWVLLFLIGVTVFFWFVPRLIDLERISGELTTPEGPVDTHQLKLKLGDDDWDGKRDELEEQLNFRQLLYLLFCVLVLLLLFATLAIRA